MLLFIKSQSNTPDRYGQVVFGMDDRNDRHLATYIACTRGITNHTSPAQAASAWLEAYAKIMAQPLEEGGRVGSEAVQLAGLARLGLRDSSGYLLYAHMRTAGGKDLVLFLLERGRRRHVVCRPARKEELPGFELVQQDGSDG